MDTSFLGDLLHLADPTLPIGGYTHSNGLETYVQKRIVKDVITAKIFIHNTILFNLKYNDAAFVRLAYEATQEKDLEKILTLDEECTALKCAREIREASQKLGIRVIKIFGRQRNFDLMLKYEQAIKTRPTGSNYCIVFGMLSQLMGIPIHETVYAFYHTSVVGMITNAVKLIPLGQLDGQDILFKLQPVIKQAVTETLSLEKSLVGLCNPALEIRCMQHERLYSRLYMS